MTQEIAQAAGEPWVSLMTPSEFADVLAAGGFAVIEDVGPGDIQHRYGLAAVGLANERLLLARKHA